MKKFLSLVLAVTLIICAVPLGALKLDVNAQTENKFGCVLNEFDSKLYAMVAYADKNISGDVVIPETWGEYEIIGISNNAFFNCENITSVTMGDNIKTIGDDAFHSCDSLSSVKLGDGLTKIGWGAFSSCEKLKNINLPDSLTTIDSYAFWDCKRLSTINIGSNLAELGENAFEHCEGLKEITVSPDNNNFCSIDGVLFDKAVERLIQYPSLKKDKEFIVPDTVKEIDECAFQEAHFIEKVSVPEGVTELKLGAFRSCRALKEVLLPTTLKSIGYQVFLECEKLQSIEIPSGVTSLDEYVFFGCCDLESIFIPKSVETIGKFTFAYCDSLKNVWYTGSTADKARITIDSSENGKLSEAQWRYFICESGTHTYTNDCDERCNKCSWTRVAHNYQNACDLSCNLCGKNRNYTLHNHSECFENEVQLLGEWKNTPKKTGIFGIKPIDYSENFTYHFLHVTDDKGNEVKYSDEKGGWPLIAGKEYTIKLKDKYDGTPINDIAFYSIQLQGKMFPDASVDDWYGKAMVYAVGIGIIKGYENGNFGVSDNIQRQDFMVMLARLDGDNLDYYWRNGADPSDVERKSYYENAVMWGYKNGIATGYQNGEFGIGDKITREQLITILYRYAQYRGIDVTVAPDAKSRIAAQYDDFNKVSGFAKDAVIWAIENDVINGKTEATIVPQGNAQRCEVAQIMYNIYMNNIFA